MARARRTKQGWLSKLTKFTKRIGNRRLRVPGTTVSVHKGRKGFHLDTTLGPDRTSRAASASRKKHPAKHALKHPVQHPIKHLAKPPAKHPVKHPVTHPFKGTLENRLMPPVKHHSKHSVKHPTRHPAKHVVAHHAKHNGNKGSRVYGTKVPLHPAKHVVTHPAKHPPKHPATHAIKHPAKHGATHAAKKAHAKTHERPQSRHAARLARRRAHRRTLAIEGVVHTEVDRIYEQVQQRGGISIRQLAKTLHMPYHTVEAWCESLADRMLVTVHYPAIGRAYVRLATTEQATVTRRRWGIIIALLVVLVLLCAVLAYTLGYINLDFLQVG